MKGADARKDDISQNSEWWADVSDNVDDPWCTRWEIHDRDRREGRRGTMPTRYLNSASVRCAWERLQARGRNLVHRDRATFGCDGRHVFLVCRRRRDLETMCRYHDRLMDAVARKRARGPNAPTSAVVRPYRGSVAYF